MMETVEVTEHRSNPELLPVQIVSSEGGRVEVISKMAPNPGHMTPDMMTATQYINLHRLPEHMNKVIVTDPISGDLIAHHVDLTSASGGEFAPHAHYYDTEELLAHGLTAEEERRIAAEIVAVQLKQGGGTLVTAQDLLNAKTLTSLSTVSMDGQKAVYIQTVEDVDMHNLQQQENAERGAIMKIYPQQQQEMQVLTRTQSQQPLPPLKKVLSSQSMMIRNKYNETPGIMVELHNSQLLDNNSCIKAEHHLEDAAATQQVVMTTTSTPTPTTTTLAPPPHPPPLLAPPPHPPPLTTAHTSASLAPPPLASNHHPPSLATTHNSAPLAPSPHPPSLAPPTDESEEEEDDGESARAASRKSLPHKKRFPRKLKATPTSGARVGAQKTYKCSKCGESFSTQHLLTAHR
ncbi:zinc finger homeobox protein 2-like [Nilaparvata lugens]|uniref:zinc finger homeobox protein 2-like n=1 Tax=Nilaparvata lugens TaxID=108931 RepID=UPI00193DD318|nr:zinc finger homeobox protein 2-like [Nilaparvata lugens]